MKKDLSTNIKKTEESNDSDCYFKLESKLCGLPSSPAGDMSSVSLLLLLLLPLLPLVSAQTYRWGPCPTPQVQPNFNLQQVNAVLKKQS